MKMHYSKQFQEELARDIGERVEGELSIDLEKYEVELLYEEALLYEAQKYS